MRRLLSPGWLTLHVVVVVGTAVMLWLGFWQWTGGFSGHTARNTGYALQWWVFAAFALYLWVKLMRDAVRGADAAPASARAPLGGLRRPAPPAPTGFREYRMASAPVVADDSDLGRYNAYLASLDAPAADAPAADAPAVDAPTAHASVVDAPAVDAPSSIRSGSSGPSDKETA